MEFKNKVTLITSDGRHDYVNKDGEIINKRSATSLIGMLYPIPEEIPENILKLASVRGTCLHNRMEIYAETGLSMKCTHYIKSHEELFRKAKLVYNSAKKKFEFDEVYTELALEGDFYVGSMDLLVKCKNGDWIIFDYKTTSYDKIKKPVKQYKKEALQLKLYEMLLPEIEIKKHYIINPNHKSTPAYSVDIYMEDAEKDIEKIKEILKDDE